MLGVGLQPRVDDTFDGAVPLQEPSHRQCVLIVVRHAHVERSDASQTKPGVHRPRDGSRGLPDEVDVLGELVIVEHEHAADDVGVAVQVFRGGVHTHVRAEGQRLLVERGRKSAVHHQEGVALVGDVGRCTDVADPDQRIRGRLDVDQPGVGAHRVPDLVRVPRVHEGEFQSELRQDARVHTNHTPVRILLAHDVVAGGEALDHGFDS